VASCAALAGGNRALPLRLGHECSVSVERSLRDPAA
jgi:hypothetical protein